MNGSYAVGYTFGTFDILRLEHLDHLHAARARCDQLVVGVLSDELTMAQTGSRPVNPYPERLQIVRALAPVDTAIGQFQDDLLEVWRQLQFDTLVLPPGVDAEAADPRLLETVQIHTLTRMWRSDSGLVERSES